MVYADEKMHGMDNFKVRVLNLDAMKVNLKIKDLTSLKGYT